MGFIKEIQSDLDNAAVRVVGEYRARLYAEAVKLCGDASEADDLVMRTFDAAFRDTSSYDATKGELYPWLVGVLRRIYAKTDRRLVNRGTTPVDPAVLQDLAGISEDTVDEILERSDHDALREAMNRLDPEYKKMLVMHYFGELPVKQIATVMNMPVGTVLWRLNIARKILARDLGEKLGKKPVAVLLAALLGVGMLFGAWVSPLGDWVAEKVFGNTPTAQVEPISTSPVTASVCVGEGVSEAGEANKKAAEPNVATPTNGNSISETEKQEGEDNMNISAKIKKTVATAAVAAMGLTAVGEYTGSMSARRYVQDGLVAQWDGIENAGHGVRSESPTVWKDLVGESDIGIPSWVTVLDDKTGFLSVGSTETRTYPTLETIPGLEGNDVTIEVVARRKRWTKTDNYDNLQNVISSSWGSFGYRKNTDTGLFTRFPPYNGASDTCLLRNSSSVGYSVSQINTLSGRITRDLAKADSDFFVNAATVSFANDQSMTLPTTTWRFFDSNRTDIEFYAIRIYNRRLTTTELKENAEIDKKRFVEKDYVLWDCKLDNVEMNSADLVWRPPAGMTLPVTVRIVTGFEPDLSDGVVHELGMASDSSVVTSRFAFVRATDTYWRAEAVDADGQTCVLEGGLMPDFRLVKDSRDYVDQGLVAQWDGIENAGRGMRSENPEVWKDLVGESDIGIPSWVTVLDDKTGFLSVGSTETRTYPTLETIPGLTGNDVTIEVVARRVRWNDTADEQNLQAVVSSPWGSFGYRFLTDTGLYSYFPPYSGNGAETLLRNSSSTGYNVAQINTLAGCVTRDSAKAVNDLFANATKVSVRDDTGAHGTLPTNWTFFNAKRTDIEFYAIRVYNRRLSNAELMANAAIDSYRFKGDVLAVAPLQIKYDGPGAAGRTTATVWPEPDEAFSHCVAPEKPMDDGTSVCLGWTLYVETGMNTWTEETRGNGCEFSYLPDDRRHRLVWHTAKANAIADGYVVHDYLESSGQQLLNTGYGPTPSTKLNLDVALLGSFQASAVGNLYGNSNSADDLRLALNFGGQSYESRTLYWWTRKSSSGGGSVKTLTISSVDLTSRNRVSLDMAAGRGTFGSATITGLTPRNAGESQTEPVFLFGSDTKSFTAYPKMRVYGARFWDGDELRFDGIPAVSQETGKCGLYDGVSGQLFTNVYAGATADFTVGAVLPLVYVEGEPSRIGAPTLPYGCIDIAQGATFTLAEPNVVKVGRRQFRLKAIDRYELDSSAEKWVPAGSERGSSITATHDGTPTKYVLRWEQVKGLVIILW